jgi:nickel/cobalt transporter (NiCoT) family protein
MDTNASLLVTLGLLLALGFRHGLDPDHIAAVDSLTRMRYSASAYWSARLTGFQFACGHSLTILLATLIFYWQGIQLPTWVDALGLWVSSAFLLYLAVVNLRHCFGGKKQPHQHTHTHDHHGHVHHHAHTHTPNRPALAAPLQAWVLKAMGPLAHPAGVGFAFAISFDSLAQAGLMAVKGNELGGLPIIVLLAVCFGAGMMLADTANGLVMHWLVQRSERAAQNAGRWMSGVIGALALLVVLVSHLREHMPVLEALWDAWGAWIGVGITATLLTIYFGHSTVRAKQLTLK